MEERSTKISKLIKSRESREAYIRAKLNVLLPAQIKGLRLHWPMTQKELGQVAQMKQSRISAMERPGAVKFNLETLVRLASAFKVGMVVKFVPFSEMLRWENDFVQDAFDVMPIDADLDFIQPQVAQRDEGEYLPNAPLPRSAGNVMVVNFPRGPVATQGESAYGAAFGAAG